MNDHDAPPLAAALPFRITNLHNVLSQAASVPWAIVPDKLADIMEALTMRGASEAAFERDARIAASLPRRAPVAAGSMHGSVAVIPLYGSIMPKANMLTEFSGGTSVAQFVQQVRAAVDNPDVSAIVLDVDSPGGAVSGVPEAADALHAMRGKKPIVAVANTLMASAAYWLAAQADSIVASASADVGSVGVYTVHRDVSRAMANEGITHTVVKAGKHKAEGMPFEPLSAEAREEMQGRVDEAYEQFVGAISRGRGVNAAAIRAGYGEGRVLSAQRAFAAGMVDRIASLDDVIGEFVGKRSAAPSRGRRAEDDAPALVADAGGSCLADDLPIDLEAVDALAALDLTAGADEPRAGVSDADVPSRTSPAPQAEETHVSNIITPAPSGATVVDDRAQRLAELVELRPEASARLPHWIRSGTTYQEARAEVAAGLGSPQATITVGAQRETLRPFETFGAQLQSVMQASTPGGSVDPRLYAAASGMSQGVPAEGGFLVAPEFSTAIWEGISGAPDAILPLTDNYTVTGESLTFNADAETSRATGSRRGGIRSYWMAEAAQYTASKPTFRQVRVEPYELGVFVYLTDKLMANSGVALQQYVSRCAADEISTMVTEAIVNGTGVGQPKGITAAGAKIEVAKETSQAAATVNQINISKMWARMHPRLRADAVWLYNVDVEPQLDALSTVVKNVADTENVGGYANKVFDAERRTLKGRPLVACESCATLGTAGDLILWSPKSYLTGTRGGVKEAMSMHLRFDYNEQAFRFLFAVDGQPWHASAITPLKGSNTLSSIVTLAVRS